MEEKKPSKEKIIVDYLKKYHEDYELEDLQEKILATGYTQSEFESALNSLGLDVHKQSKLREFFKGKKIQEIFSGKDDKGPESQEKPDAHQIKEFSRTINQIKKEVAKAIVGQEVVIDSLIGAILCDGHVLLEGVPGIAKTLAIKSIAQASGCQSKRIQFTVDLLPTDILGLTTYTPEKGFEIVKGPIFSNFIIADEINRSPPKTQSALIEAMQEKQVTIGRETFKLPLPFFVMATENPLETGGVYTLPEAQIDRFLFKVNMGYPNMEEEEQIMSQNATLKKFDSFNVEPISTPEKIVEMQSLTKRIYLSKKIRKYILRIIELTRTKELEHGEYVEWGSSPRATIGLFIASKARALIKGRNFVVPGDVKGGAYEVLRHRIILSYKARVERINSDKIIDEILRKVKVP